MEEFQPLESFLIEDVETLRVMADPIRIQILELLATQALTVKQVADRLGLASSKLYYHINTLQKHELVTLVGTKMVSNLQEKYYRATANQITVSETLLQLAPDGVMDPITSIITSTLDTTREDLLRSFQARNFELQQGATEEIRSAMITRHIMKINEGQANDFMKKLQALVEEFNAADTKADDIDVRSWAFTVAFYPTIYFPEEEE